MKLLDSLPHRQSSFPCASITSTIGSVSHPAETGFLPSVFNLRCHPIAGGYPEVRIATWASVPTSSASVYRCGDGPYRKLCAAHGGCDSSKRTAKLERSAALLESGDRNFPMGVCAGERSSDRDFKAPRIGRRSLADSGSFRQPVVRSDGAVHQPAVAPRRPPFPAAESLVAPVSPSPTRDVFSIGDSNRNTN